MGWRVREEWICTDIYFTGWCRAAGCIPQEPTDHKFLLCLKRKANISWKVEAGRQTAASCEHPKIFLRNIFRGLKCTGERGWDAAQSLKAPVQSLKSLRNKPSKLRFKYKMNLEWKLEALCNICECKRTEGRCQVEGFHLGLNNIKNGKKSCQKSYDFTVVAWKLLYNSKCYSLCVLFEG